ncbi:MAG: eukaryotic-like serine/threonine-protein kinase [Myxococcales bacterium]|nr:eukaryotic-like serine/threonine-protein kinase [Myxococcales bacterium]
MLIGTVIRDYRIVTELGGGGMGTVYFAEHTVIGRRAAIKVLNPDVSANTDIVARFFTEAKAVNAIRHPNIVDITDFGHVGKLYFIIMEMLEGETLGARMESVKPLPALTTVRVLSQVGSAVGAVHERGMVHRDLKPENIFLTNHPDYPDFVKVLDFGVVKLMGTPPAASHKTQPGTAIGTPAYMSPEQCLGLAALDHRSDVYSLGVVAYEMLAGVPPFTGDALEQMMGHTRGALVPPKKHNPAVGDALNVAIVRALEKKPEDRFASLRDFRSALEAAVAPARPSVSPTKAAVAVVAAIKPEPAAPAKVDPAKKRRAREGVPMPQDPVEVARIERAQTKKVGSKLREIIAQRIATNRMTVPAMPVVALRCLEIMRDPNAEFAEIASIIEKDPLVASRLLRIVNSPAYGSREAISSVKRAVARLGLQPLKLLLMEMSAREVFMSRNPRIRDAFRGIWEHCLAVGILARDTASALNSGVDGEMAYLGGLFHDVGKPVAGALLLEAERSLIDDLDEPFMSDSLWMKVVDSAHRDVGAALAESWHLSPTVAETISDLTSYDTEAAARSCRNVVRYANALTKREGLYVGEIDLDAVLGVIADGRTLLGIDEPLEQRLIGGLRERVETVTTAAAEPAAGTISVQPGDQSTAARRR